MNIIICLVCTLLMELQQVSSQLDIQYGGDVMLTQKELAKVERMADFEIEFYRQFGLPDTMQLRMTLFEDKNEGRAYLSKIYNGLSPHLSTGGIYLDKNHEAVIWEFRENRERKLAVIYHEMSHYFQHRIFRRRLPVWISEGLSEYFEHCEVKKKSIRHIMSEYEEGRIRSMYMLNEVNLKSFVDISYNAFMGRQRMDENYSYILAHALIAFFLDDCPREIFVALFNSLQDNDYKISVYERIDRIYPGGFSSFKTDFRKKFAGQ